MCVVLCFPGDLNVQEGFAIATCRHNLVWSLWQVFEVPKAGAVKEPKLVHRLNIFQTFMVRKSKMFALLYLSVYGSGVDSRRSARRQFSVNGSLPMFAFLPFVRLLVPAILSRNTRTSALNRALVFHCRAAVHRAC